MLKNIHLIVLVCESISWDDSIQRHIQTSVKHLRWSVLQNYHEFQPSTIFPKHSILVSNRVLNIHLQQQLYLLITTRYTAQSQQTFVLTWWRRFHQDEYIHLIFVLKMSWPYIFKTPSRRFQGVFKTSSRRLQDIRGHKGQNSTETRCRDFLVLESRCRGFSALESRCRGFLSSEKMSWNHDVVVYVPPRPRFRFH